MDVLQIIKLIAEIGFPIVAAGILLFFTWQMFHKNQIWLDQLITGISRRTECHPDKEKEEHLSAINAKIYEEIRGLSNTLGADRAYVVLYHNGGRSSSGLYFQKMSCICEIVSSGISSFSESFQQIHRSSYMYMINLLEKDHEVLVDDAEMVKDQDSFLYGQLNCRHVKSVYLRVLLDIEGSPIGFIGIDYCSKNEMTPHEKISSLLRTVGHKISALADVRDEVK